MITALTLPQLRRTLSIAAKMPVGQARSIVGALVCKKGKINADRRRLGRIHFARRKKSISKMHAAVMEAFDGARNEVIANIKKAKQIKAKGALVCAESGVDLTFDKEKFGNKLAANVKETGREVLNTAGQQLIEEIGKDEIYKIANKKAVEFLDGRAARMADISANIDERVTAELQEGLNAGEGRADLTKRIMGLFDDMSKGHAQTIANTETGAAYGFARDDAMAQGGVEKKQWLHSTSGDIKQPREMHEELDGDVKGIDEPFEVGDDLLMYPCADTDESDGGESSPEQVINCHCVCLPYFEEDNE